MNVEYNIVCYGHFSDYAIIDFIKRSGETERCDYCGKRRKTVSLESLSGFLMEAVHHFYTDPVQFSPYNGGYAIESDSAWNIIVYEFELDVSDKKISEHLWDCIDDGSVYANEKMYRDDGHYYLPASWGMFCNTINHKVRYFFHGYHMDELDRTCDPREMLDIIGQLVKEYKLIIKVEKGQRLFRFRQHNIGEQVNEPKDLCTPAVEFCVNQNRMSPAGIPMFYAAFDRETAYRETIDVTNLEKKAATSVEWELKDEIKVVDLSALPSRPSVFDQNRYEDYEKIFFLQEFIKDLSKPVLRDGKVNIDYIPTQVVTEYFRYGMAEKVDGIIYPSSKNPRGKAIVLFYDQEESLERMEFLSETLDTRQIADD